MIWAVFNLSSSNIKKQKEIDEININYMYPNISKTLSF